MSIEVKEKIETIVNPEVTGPVSVSVIEESETIVNDEETIVEENVVELD